VEEISLRPTSLDGVFLITPPTVFRDFRGRYVEIYNQTIYRRAGIDHDFIQDDVSVSRRGVLRGIHGDEKTWKLISCLQGSFYLVVINNNSDSSQYLQWEAFTLSDEEPSQVLIPPKFGNGHLVLTDQAIFHYKQTTTYDRTSQFTLNWNDPKLEIWWPKLDPLTSRRDEGI